MPDDPFELTIIRFERAWRLGTLPGIAEALQDLPALGESDRLRLLVELICIDLEYRWRNSGTNEPIALEGYVERFPELVGLDALPIELIGEEYRARRLWGDRPSHSAFLAPFRARRESIRDELRRVDEEIEAESRLTPGAARPAVLDARALEELGPLLSHRNFLLQRLIGAGRMGKVYEAREHETGRTVALKFLRKSLLHHPEVVARFVGEARMAARLCHPKIVGTQGLGQAPAGAFFLVMDLVAGPNLAEVARQRPIDVSEAVGWTIEACEALAHAHERGVVHCDVKPANLLLDPSGNIRVTDFGLARGLTDRSSRGVEVEGTAPFMAPEQVSRALGSIDQRTDVYGVGATLYTLLTGRPPYLGRRVPDVLAQVISGAPLVPLQALRGDVSEPLDALCMTCLSRRPEGRFGSITELRLALAGLTDMTRSAGQGTG